MAGPGRTLATTVALTALLVLAAAAASTRADPPARSGGVVPRPTPAHGARHVGPQGAVGQFVVRCGYSHSGDDDPIVHPGHPGRSHRHDFFGSTTTDAESTARTLRAGPTTCRNPADTAAYWTPALLDHGVAVRPLRSTAYYRAGPGVDPASLRSPPPGLAVVAGDFTATAPQPLDVVGWGCGVSSRLSPTPPECPPAAPLRLTVTFPDCWDGVSTDSPDHRSHLTRSRGGRCPDSHPVAVPQLTFAVDYPVSGPGHDLSLASGSLLGAHADFLNGWDPAGLEREVRNCLHRDVVCGLGSNRAEDAPFLTG